MVFGSDLKSVAVVLFSLKEKASFRSILFSVICCFLNGKFKLLIHHFLKYNLTPLASQIIKLQNCYCGNKDKMEIFTLRKKNFLSCSLNVGSCGQIYTSTCVCTAMSALANWKPPFFPIL